MCMSKLLLQDVDQDKIRSESLNLKYKINLFCFKKSAN